MFPSFRAPETMTAINQTQHLKATAAHDDPRELRGLNIGEVGRFPEALPRAADPALRDIMHELGDTRYS